MLAIGKKVPTEHIFELKNNEVVNIEPWKNRFRFGAFVVWAMFAVYIAFSPIGVVGEGGADMVTAVVILGIAVILGVGAVAMEKKYNSK